MPALSEEVTITVRQSSLEWAAVALEAYYVREREILSREGTLGDGSQRETAMRLVWKALEEVRAAAGDHM